MATLLHCLRAQHQSARYRGHANAQSQADGITPCKAAGPSVQSVSTWNGAAKGAQRAWQGELAQDQQPAACVHTCHLRLSEHCWSNGAAWVDDATSWRLAAARRWWRWREVGKARGRRGWWPLVAGRQSRECELRGLRWRQLPAERSSVAAAIKWLQVHNSFHCVTTRFPRFLPH